MMLVHLAVLAMGVSSRVLSEAFVKAPCAATFASAQLVPACANDIACAPCTQGSAMVTSSMVTFSMVASST
jgi:hypothetical protein